MAWQQISRTFELYANKVNPDPNQEGNRGVPRGGGEVPPPTGFK